MYQQKDLSLPGGRRWKLPDDRRGSRKQPDKKKLILQQRNCHKNHNNRFLIGDHTCVQEAQGSGALTGFRQFEHLLPRWEGSRQCTKGSSTPNTSPCCTGLRATTWRPCFSLCFTSTQLERLGYLELVLAIFAASSFLVSRLFLV